MPCDDSEQVITLPSGRFAKSKCGQTLTICANGTSTTATVGERSDRNAWEVSGAIAKALGVEPDFHGSIYPEPTDPDMKDDRKCTPKPKATPSTPSPPVKHHETERY